jgi:hypothetical protein
MCAQMCNQLNYNIGTLYNDFEIGHSTELFRAIFRSISPLRSLVELCGNIEDKSMHCCRS